MLRHRDTVSLEEEGAVFLTQAAVAEVLPEADVAQLAGRDLADLQSHGRALAHRLHAHTHRLHLQHQHRHLEEGDTQRHTESRKIQITRSIRYTRYDKNWGSTFRFFGFFSQG